MLILLFTGLYQRPNCHIGKKLVDVQRIDDWAMPCATHSKEVCPNAMLKPLNPFSQKKTIFDV